MKRYQTVGLILSTGMIFIGFAGFLGSGLASMGGHDDPELLIMGFWLLGALGMASTFALFVLTLVGIYQKSRTPVAPDRPVLPTPSGLIAHTILNLVFGMSMFGMILTLKALDRIVESKTAGSEQEAGLRFQAARRLNLYGSVLIGVEYVLLFGTMFWMMIRMILP